MNEYVHYLELAREPLFLYGAATGALVLLILLLIISLLRREKKTVAAFESENGVVHVSRRALQDLIQRCCEDAAGVGRARARLTTSRGEINTKVSLRLKSNTKLGNISGYLQEQISTVLQDNLGVENIGKVDIVVVGIEDEPDENRDRVTISARNKVVSEPGDVRPD